MFRRRPKHAWTVDFGPRGQVSTSNATLAISLLICRVAELQMEIDSRESLRELQTRMVSLLRARMHASEKACEEYRGHLIERTSQLHALQDALNTATHGLSGVIVDGAAYRLVPIGQVVAKVQS